MIKHVSAWLSVLGLVTVAAGCASAEPSPDDTVVPADDTATPQGYTVSFNCAKSLPGLPPYPCKPDLVFGQTVVQVWKPNNPQNIAPGRYIYFGFTNDSDKPTGPFTVRITNNTGGVEQSVPFAGLAPHQSATVIEPAPYACGWSRTAKLDFGDSVEEFSESNNEQTYDFMCPRLPPFGGLSIP